MQIMALVSLWEGGRMDDRCTCSRRVIRLNLSNTHRHIKHTHTPPTHTQQQRTQNIGISTCFLVRPSLRHYIPVEEFF
jgi:hypothetical protein